MEIDKKTFLAQREPRFGSANPELHDFESWQWLVLNDELSAYHANEKFDGPSPDDAGPGWCFERFGRTTTELPDGRTVHIGGEHEDFYDPDFYIYNDVVVLTPTDAEPEVSIYGYPEDVFPPTDFHSATLVGERIFLIGCLGYEDERRPGETPVFVLDLGDLSISLVPTTGAAPGWIYEHAARLTEDGSRILVSGGKVVQEDDQFNNVDEFALAIETGEWQRLTQRPWQKWSVRRVDDETFSIVELESALWDERHPKCRMYDNYLEKLESAGCHFDAEAIEQLFVPPGAKPLADQEGDRGYDTARIVFEGAKVRYNDHSRSIDINIDGELSNSAARALCEDLASKLALLHRAECVVRCDGSSGDASSPGS